MAEKNIHQFGARGHDRLPVDLFVMKDQEREEIQGHLHLSEAVNLQAAAQSAISNPNACRRTCEKSGKRRKNVIKREEKNWSKEPGGSERNRKIVRKLSLQEKNPAPRQV